MNTTSSNNSRINTILVVALIGLLILIAVNMIFWFFVLNGSSTGMMNNWMMNGGMMNRNIMNQMQQTCLALMQSR